MKTAEVLRPLHTESGQAGSEQAGRQIRTMGLNSARSDRTRSHMHVLSDNARCINSSMISHVKIPLTSLKVLSVVQYIHTTDTLYMYTCIQQTSLGLYRQQAGRQPPHPSKIPLTSLHFFSSVCYSVYTYKRYSLYTCIQQTANFRQ